MSFKDTKIWKYSLLSTLYFLLSTLLIGCATVTKGPPALRKGMVGVYHRVKKSETLWRISKAYEVKMEEITHINRFAEASRIYVGQLIFVPGRTKIIEDLTLETDFQDKAGDFIWPVKGKINSFFGMKKNEVKNKGIYIQTKMGSDILASRSGKVAFCSKELKGYGKIIIIDHLDGYSTVYAQNSKNLVKVKQLVRQSQLIAQAGSAGQQSIGELYFEIRKTHKPLNPFFYLP